MNEASPYPAPNLPVGTLTFLFTDVEGSTRLWEQSLEQMREVMVRHDTLIESAVAQWGGVLVRPLSAEQANQQGIVNCLGALAGLAAMTGQPIRATHLFAAAEKLRQAIRARMGSDDRREY